MDTGHPHFEIEAGVASGRASTSELKGTPPEPVRSGPLPGQREDVAGSLESEGSRTQLTRTSDDTLGDDVGDNSSTDSSPQDFPRSDNHSPSFSGNSPSSRGLSSGGPTASIGSPNSAASAQTTDAVRGTRFHPADEIGKFLLKQKPGAEMAIVPDDDWISVLRKDDSVLPSPEEFLSRILAVNDIIVDDHGE
ncbi:hypothetical protein BDZ97DRAFT_1819289 [Flammula alnicola]|nr:hypothetical protein BDZ97DRAFT_1819289 [Flammula alnicola]